MQQIFSFLGAIPNLIDKEIENVNVDYIRLKNNYRFETNKEMKQLDIDLRAYQKDPSCEYRIPRANLKVIHGTSIDNEGEKILSLIRKLKKNDPKATCAILVSQHRKNTNALLKSIHQNINFFNALFSDKDENFILFQNTVATVYQEDFNTRPITKSNEKDFVKKVEENINYDEYTTTFVALLTAFLDKTIANYFGEIRSEVILETMSTYSLRQSITDIKESLVVSTIHGAKGLEWDYVIIANFEQDELPNYHDIQHIGQFMNGNNFNYAKQNINEIRKLINKFYVAFTRAKKDVFVSYSDMHWTGSYESQLKVAKISCLGTLSFLNMTEVNY